MDSGASAGVVGEVENASEGLIRSQNPNPVAKSATSQGHPCSFYSDVDALLAEKDDQAAWRECGAEVVASGDTVGEEQDGIVFESAGIIQDVVFADVLLDFAVE